MPVISPGGDRIVCAKAGGRPPLMLTMLMLRDSVVPNKLPTGLPEGYSQLPSDWSPDGRFIAMTCNPFDRGRQQNADVYLVDLARSGELVPLLVSPRREDGAVFAPDGRSIAFLSDESGRPEVYVQPFDPEARRVTGNRRQISRGGAALVRWPRPGHEVFYLGADYWIYATTLSGEPKRLFPASPEAISRLHPPFSFAVAPGGERFLLPAYRGDRPSSLAVVLNWENLVDSISASAVTR